MWTVCITVRQRKIGIIKAYIIVQIALIASSQKDTLIQPNLMNIQWFLKKIFIHIAECMETVTIITNVVLANGQKRLVNSMSNMYIFASQHNNGHENIIEACIIVQTSWILQESKIKKNLRNSQKHSAHNLNVWRLWQIIWLRSY